VVLLRSDCRIDECEEVHSCVASVVGLQSVLQAASADQRCRCSLLSSPMHDLQCICHLLHMRGGCNVSCLLLQLESAVITTRIYSPVSTAAVDVQLRYCNQVSTLPDTTFHCVLALHIPQQDAPLQYAGKCSLCTKHSLASNEGFLSCCQARAYSVEYHSSVHYALVDASKHPYDSRHEVSCCHQSSIVCTHPEAVENGKDAVVCMVCALTALVASDPLRSPALQDSAWINLYVLTNNEKDPRLVHLCCRSKTS
jgi:hypothetical protein